MEAREFDPGRAVQRRKALFKSLSGLVLLAFLVGALLLNQSIRTKAQVDQPAPDWTAESLDGQPVSLTDFRGRVVLLNLWTTWCVTCKEETPALQAFHERYGDRVAVIGLDVREPVRVVREYMERAGVTYTVLRDRSGRAADRYNLKGYPETWFIDPQGIARAFWQGPLTFEQMQTLYFQATGEPIDGAGVAPVPAGDRLLTAALEPGRPGSFWVATRGGLMRGPGGAPGAGWQRVRAGEVAALALPVRQPGTVLAAGPGLGVVRSRDGGRTWQEAGAGLPGRDVSALAASPSGSVLYAWVTGHGLFRSQDGGDSWQAVGGGLDARLPVVALAVDPSDAQHLLAAWAHGGDLGGWEGRLLESRDGGRSFAEVPVEEDILEIRTRPAVFGIAFDPERPGRVYLATEKGIWRSDAGGRGATWLKGSHARLFQAVSAAGGLVVAAAPNGDLYVSRDGGGTWRLTGEEVEGGGR